MLQLTALVGEDLPAAIGAASEAWAVHKDIALGICPAHVKCYVSQATDAQQIS